MSKKMALIFESVEVEVDICWTLEGSEEMTSRVELDDEIRFRLEANEEEIARLFLFLFPDETITQRRKRSQK